MIITCPSCRTRYRIQPDSLGAGGRTVRCSSCGHRWFVEPYAELATPPPLAPERVEPTVEAIPAKPARAKEGRGSSILGWLFLALLVLLMGALIAGRDRIVTQFPGTLPVYRQLGLAVDPPLALEFGDLASAEREENGRKMLVVTGLIQNVSGEERTLPPIRVALLDETGREIDFGLFDPPQPALGPGGSARFEVELGSLPPEARNFTVSLGDRP